MLTILDRIFFISILCIISFVGISKAAAEIGIVVGVIAFFLSILFYHKKPVWPPLAVTSAFAFFLLWGFISLCVNHPPVYEGFRGMLKWLKYVGLFWISFQCFRSSRMRQQAVNLFLLSMLVISLNGIYQFFMGVDLIRGYAMDPGRVVRMKSCFSASNLLAMFYLFAIPLSVAKWFQSSPVKRNRSIFLTLFFLIGFILTFSRSAFYGMLAAGVIYLFVMRRFKWLLGMAVGVILLLQIPEVRYNFMNSIGQQDVSLSNRLSYWESGWSLVREHPVFGVGLNQYYKRVPEVHDSTGVYRGYAHNSYLQVLAENGVVGFLLFLFGVFYVLFVRPSDTRQYSNDDQALMHGLQVSSGAFLLHAFWDVHFFALQPATLFWLMLGMLTSLKFSK